MIALRCGVKINESEPKLLNFEIYTCVHLNGLITHCQLMSQSVELESAQQARWSPLATSTTSKRSTSTAPHMCYNVMGVSFW